MDVERRHAILAAWEVVVPFSWPQWIAVIVLDVVFRAASFVIPLYVILAIPVSMLHLSLLIPISAYVRTFDHLSRSAAARITLLSTNVLFAIAFVICQLISRWRGRVTSCSYECSWVDGVITWRGVELLAGYTLLQVSVNLASILIVCAFSGCFNKAHERAPDPTAADRG